MGKDEQQISMNPPELMLAPYFMTDVEYNVWGSSISYAEWLLERLDYDEFNITRLMPSLIVQVHAQSLFPLFLPFCLSGLIVWEIAIWGTCR